MKKCSDIIADLYNGKNFNECLSKMEPEHLREDLRQEVILVICELPEEKIIGMHERKELEFYTVRVVLNMIRNPDNQFSKAYMKYTGELTGNEEVKESSCLEVINDRSAKEKLQDKILRLINTTDKEDSKWYHKELLKIYLDKGNYRSVSNDTLIPFTSVFQSITDYKKNLKEIFANPIYTQTEAAKILNVSRMTLNEWERKKIIKPVERQRYRRGGLIYTKAEIERVQVMRKNRYNNSDKAKVIGLKEKELDKLPPLNAKIIKLYKQLGNLQAVGKNIGLHQEVCRMNIKRSIEILEKRSEIKEGIDNQKLLDQTSLNHLNLMNTLEYLNQNGNK